MSIEERIAALKEFRSAVLEWQETRDPDEKRKLRSFLVQNRPKIRREVVEAGCQKTLTIGPPPAVGGLVMRNVDPFEMMFDPPYLMSLVPQVVDMIDETIGVLSSPEFEETLGKEDAQGVEDDAQIIEEAVEEGYAFVAMPMDRDDHDLEDVLDAIKEACGRCGIRAERIDEPESNERITDRMLESIRRAEYVIVDLTKSRPNVYYEAGYAQGLGKTPIYIAREGTALEFDLKDYPIILFPNLRVLKERLQQRIRGLAEE